MRTYIEFRQYKNKKILEFLNRMNIKINKEKNLFNIENTKHVKEIVYINKIDSKSNDEYDLLLKSLNKLQKEELRLINNPVDGIEFAKQKFLYYFNNSNILLSPRQDEMLEEIGLSVDIFNNNKNLQLGLKACLEEVREEV